MPSTPVESRKPVVLVEGLAIHFGATTRPVRAVDSVSFEIFPGEVVALVGESGCGKTATALALARLLPEPAARYAAGRIRVDDLDVRSADERALRRLRGGVIAYVFQEPGAALNPVWSIGFQIGEALAAHRPDCERDVECERLLRAVGLDDVKRIARSYPHELSGGQQQRAVIAMALAGRPKVLVADEPTTALDVTVQAQVLELLVRVQRETEMAMLFITHNLALAAKIADRVMVMYAGQIVEVGPAREVLTHPRHPYTQALMRALPRTKGDFGRLEGISGAVPSAADYPRGCRFHPRCRYVRPGCASEEPDLMDGVRCPFWREIAP